VNLIVIDKQPQLQWLDLASAKERCAPAPDVVLAAAGDVQTLETTDAAWWLRRHAPELKGRVVNVVNLMTLFPPDAHPHGMSRDRFVELFTEDKPVVFAFHGYRRAIHEILHGRPARRGSLPRARVHLGAVAPLMYRRASVPPSRACRARRRRCTSTGQSGTDAPSPRRTPCGHGNNRDPEGTLVSPRRPVVILIRTSRYDDDGHVVRHRCGTLPSNTLSGPHSLTEDAVRAGVFGRVRTEVIDEIVSRAHRAALARRSSARWRSSVCTT
jgi:hypothetical protein